MPYLIFPYGYQANYIAKDWPFEPDPAQQCGHRAPDGLLVCTLNDTNHGLLADQHVAHDPANSLASIGEWQTHDPIGVIYEVRDQSGNVIRHVPANRRLNTPRQAGLTTNPQATTSSASTGVQMNSGGQAGSGQVKRAYEPAVQGSDSIEEWDLLPDPTIEESQRLLTWEELNEKDHEKILGHKRRVQ